MIVSGEQLFSWIQPRRNRNYLELKRQTVFESLTSHLTNLSTAKKQEKPPALNYLFTSYANAYFFKVNVNVNAGSSVTLCHAAQQINTGWIWLYQSTGICYIYIANSRHYFKTFINHKNTWYIKMTISLIKKTEFWQTRTMEMVSNALHQSLIEN